MGKQRSQRKKFHTPSKCAQETAKQSSMGSVESLPLQLADNVFAGLDISIESLKQSLADDARSVASLKSIRSEQGDKPAKKKDKIKMRRDMLLKRIDTVRQLKKENQKRNKRKKLAVIGNTNPLHDALPSLQTLLKSSKVADKPKEKVTKSKAIEKASMRKKRTVEGVKILKKVMADKDFQKNPLDFVAEKIKLAVEQQKFSVK